MTPVHGSAARLYWAGFDISNAFGQATAERTRDVADSTCFGDTAHRFTVGLADGKLTADGIFTSTPSAPPDADSQLRAALDLVAPIVSYAPEGAAIGNPVEVIAGTETAYSITAPVTDVVKVHAEAMASHGLERCVSLHDMAQEAAGTVASASVDNGASSSAGIVGVLHVTDIVTGGSITVKIQHATDNSTWVDLVTFTTVSDGSEPSAERIVVAGTVNRYLRARAVVSTAAVTYHVAAGRTPRNG